MLERKAFKVPDFAVGVQGLDKKIDDFTSDRNCSTVRKWLNSPDPSLNYNKALQQRHQGTGSWFLKSDIFAQWKTRPNSFLWLHGIPGCGKTILSSTIIEDLDKSASSRALLYFDFNDTGTQSLDNMIRSLISQLYHKREDTRKPLDSLFSSCDDGRRQPTTESLCETLQNMFQQVDEVDIVLDALDECRTRKGTRNQGLLSWMKALQELWDHEPPPPCHESPRRRY